MLPPADFHRHQGDESIRVKTQYHIYCRTRNKKPSLWLGCVLEITRTIPKKGVIFSYVGLKIATISISWWNNNNNYLTIVSCISWISVPFLGLKSCVQQFVEGKTTPNKWFNQLTHLVGCYPGYSWSCRTVALYSVTLYIENPVWSCLAAYKGMTTAPYMRRQLPIQKLGNYSLGF